MMWLKLNCVYHPIHNRTIASVMGPWGLVTQTCITTSSQITLLQTLIKYRIVPNSRAGRASKVRSD